MLLEPNVGLYWHKSPELTFRFTASSLQTSELLFFPPHPQPGPFIFTVRVKHISSDPCRICSRLSCVPYHQIIKFQKSLTGLARWGLVKSIEGSSRGLDSSLSQLILCSLFLLGLWVSPYLRSAFALTFSQFRYDVRELPTRQGSTTQGRRLEKESKCQSAICSNVISHSSHTLLATMPVKVLIHILVFF